MCIISFMIKEGEYGTCVAMRMNSSKPKEM